MKKILFFLIFYSVIVCTEVQGETFTYEKPDYTNPISKDFKDIQFETAKLIPLLNDFPKGADLHSHATGALYIENLLMYAAKNNFYYDPEKMILTKDAKSNENLIPVLEFINDPTAVSNYKDKVSIRGWHDTTSGSDHFFSTFRHISKDEYNKENVADIINRNYSQRVRYQEIMANYMPDEVYEKLFTLLPESEFPKDLTKENLEIAYKKIQAYLDSAKFAKTINDALSSYQKEVAKITKEKYGLDIEGNTPDAIVKYINNIYRLQSPYHIFLASAANLKATQLNQNLVAINILQDESHIHSLMYFNDQMKVLDFLWEKLNKPNIALHAGELALQESPLLPMRSRISDSIKKGHALRIGHGVSLPWEENPEETLKMMREQGIAIEICLSSNDMILGVSGKDHPMRMYLEAGVPITIATDDDAILRSNLTMEYIKAMQEHNLSYDELKKIAKNGLEYSFLKGKSIYNDDGTVAKEFTTYLEGPLPSISTVGAKAYLQIRHERDLAAYEKNLKF